MPTYTTIELHSPKDWNELEDICADLFSRIWVDRNTLRCGRSGSAKTALTSMAIYPMEKTPAFSARVSDSGHR